MTKSTIKFADVFSGLGGFRLGFENACKSLNIKCECVFASEIKPHAIETYKKNFQKTHIHGNILDVKDEDIPKFDVLLAGFPCQSFSSAGAQRGFLDTRGTLFFQIERLLKLRKPTGFILENVQGLVKHDIANPKKQIGRTLETMLNILRNGRLCQMK